MKKAVHVPFFGIVPCMRDWCVVRCNTPACSGRYSLLQKIRLAAPGYLARTPSCTRQLRATCIYRLTVHFAIPSLVRNRASRAMRPHRTSLAHRHTARGSRISCLRTDNIALCCACTQKQFPREQSSARPKLTPHPKSVFL